MVRLSKTIGTRAAKIASKDPRFDAAAQDVASDVRITAAAHRDTGDFQGSITVKPVRGSKGVTDRLVTSTDRAALSIEYGHFSQGTGGRKLRYVPGLFIFARVAARHR